MMNKRQVHRDLVSIGALKQTFVSADKREKQHVNPFNVYVAYCFEETGAKENGIARVGAQCSDLIVTGHSFCILLRSES